MKAVWIAIGLLIASVAIVTFNSITLSLMFDNMYCEVASASDADITEAGEKYQEILDEYKGRISLIALSIKHSELSDIEESLTELISSCRAGNAEEAQLIKSRLMSELSHIRRLVGFNIDSIF